MLYESPYLAHFGIAGMKWGDRRYQNEDGTLTPEGQARYNKELDNAREDLKKHPGFSNYDRYYLNNKYKDSSKISEKDRVEARRKSLNSVKRGRRILAAAGAVSLAGALISYGLMRKHYKDYKALRQMVGNQPVYNGVKKLMNSENKIRRSAAFMKGFAQATGAGIGGAIGGTLGYKIAQAHADRKARNSGKA